MNILLNVLIDRYLASSTPGEASDRYYAIMQNIERHGRTSNDLDDQIEQAERQVNRRFTPETFSDVFVDEHFGHETYVRMMRCETLIGLRHAMRDLNPGRIDICSDYDCTGLVCGMNAKLLKVYKAYHCYVGVIEVCISRDV